MERKTLVCLQPGQQATVVSVDTDDAMRRRLFDIGLIANTRVKCVGRSPCSDPSAYLIRGAVIALRAEICEKIYIK